MKRLWEKGLLALVIKSAGVITLATVASSISISAQAAAMTEDLVQNYAAAMKSAANSKNINQGNRVNLNLPHSQCPSPFAHKLKFVTTTH